MSPWIRSVAERMSRDVVFKRRLPERFNRAPIFVSPEQGLRFWRFNMGACVPDLFDLVAEFVSPGMTVWDIGANLGMFSFAAAHAAGPRGFVLSIEPDIETARLLAKTRRLQNSDLCAPVDIVPIAVSDGTKRFSRFQIAARSRSSNALEGCGGSQSGNWRETRVVPTYAMDELLEHFPAPKFMKVDIEGAEQWMLRGAKKLFTEIRPTLAIEVLPDNPENPRKVGELLHEYGYKLYDAERPPAERVELPLPAYNTLAVPN
jgi:FkbM family methyltransferase